MTEGNPKRIVHGSSGRFTRADQLDRTYRPGQGTKVQTRHLDVRVTPDLLHRLKLIRHLTGFPSTEWVRWQIQMAVDLELSRRPGTLWLRPGSRIYQMQLRGPDAIPVPLATSLGGERVWMIEVIPDLQLGQLDDQLPDGMTGAGVVCDLSAEEPGHLDLRRVVVAAADCLPREPMPWTTGFFTLKDARRRETARKKKDLTHLFRPASGPDESPPRGAYPLDDREPSP